MNARFLCVTALLLAARFSAMAAPNVVVWDTGARGNEDRAKWKAVPSDLLLLEKDPGKASSDPGYYGREYIFSGDVVVENNVLTTAFSSASGRVSIFSKPNKLVAEFAPQKGGAMKSFELIRNAGDEAVLKANYAQGVSATFSFGRNEIVEIKASEDAIGLASPIEYGVVPGFVGDDMIYEAAAEEVTTVAENIFIGLLKGGDSMVVLTWPGAKSRFSVGPALKLSGSPEQTIYLAAISAPGIWHRQKLDSSFLEKVVELDWQRPFPAKWQTQFSEGAVKTRYNFRQAKGTVWRGVPGSYNYPAWFEGEKAFFNLSKKVPPRDEAIIYFLEGQETPAPVLTPVDVLKATLGRAAAEPILDVEGRKLRTHHGGSGSNVHRACTCGYTEAIQAVFEKKQEVEQKNYIDQSIADMIYFVEQHVARIDEYRHFSKELGSFLQAKAKEAPEMKEFLDGLNELAQQIPQECENQKENMKSLAFAGDLAKKTMALTAKYEPTNLNVYMDLLKAWRAMGGAQDYVVAQCHTLTRKIFQDASDVFTQPNAADVAKEIRARCKAILRNPDGYEIWANY